MPKDDTQNHPTSRGSIGSQSNLNLLSFKSNHLNHSISMPGLKTNAALQPKRSEYSTVATIDITTTPEFHRFVEDTNTPYAEGLNVPKPIQLSNSTSLSRPNTTSNVSRGTAKSFLTSNTYRPPQSSSSISSLPQVRPNTSHSQQSYANVPEESLQLGTAIHLPSPQELQQRQVLQQQTSQQTSQQPQQISQTSAHTLPSQQRGVLEAKERAAMVHTPPTNWGFADGGSILMTEEEMEDGMPSPLPSRNSGRPPRSSPLRNTNNNNNSSILSSSFSMQSTSLTQSSSISPINIVDQPRSTSAGGIIISARLQMALVNASDRPTTCPGDLEGRLTSDYFRPSSTGTNTSIGGQSVTSLNSLGSDIVSRRSYSRNGSRNGSRNSRGSMKTGNSRTGSRGSVMNSSRTGSRTGSRHSSSRPSTSGSIGSVEEAHASTIIQSILRMKKANIYTWNPDGGLAAKIASVKIQRIYR